MTTTPQWQAVASMTELRDKGRLRVRRDGKQIAVFQTPEGILACNNRCPHEGYPLIEGTLDDTCVLTCNWHNWKFRLDDGSNLYGGDGLRTYPADVRGDDIWLDLSDPPIEERRAAAFASLRDAFDDGDYERVARELGRLELLGVEPTRTLSTATAWTSERLEFGWTHAFAGTADWLWLRDRFAGDDDARLTCILESVGHMADDVLREPAYPYPDAVEDYDEDGFVTAIEREDEVSAIGMMRGAVRDERPFESLERGLTRAALAHYLQFGHALIYVPKAAALVEKLDRDAFEPLLLALARMLIYARREDLIPEFRDYEQRLAAWDPQGTATDDWTPWRRSNIRKSLELTATSGGVSADDLYDRLLTANAYRLLTFELERQDASGGKVQDNVSWLDFTHGVTFANAVRTQCSRFPELWPQGLLQMACFAGRNAGFTHKDAESAQALLAHWRVDDADAFFSREFERLMTHDCDEFIVSVHRLKTLVAAYEEWYSGVSDVAGEYLLAGVNRYLNAPMRLKNPRRAAHQARQFVALDG